MTRMFMDKAEPTAYASRQEENMRNGYQIPTADGCESAVAMFQEIEWH